MIERVALLSIHSSPLAPVGSEFAGGMNIYVRRLADELAGRGIQVDMFTRRTDRQSPEIVQTEAGARLIHLDAGPPKPIPKSVMLLHVPSTVAAMKAFMAREGIRYDVLHSHYWLSGLVATRVRDDDRIPIVHMFHTLSRVKELHTGVPDSGDSALRADGERCVVNSADLIVGATEDERGYIERLYERSSARYAVVPPGVDLDHFRPQGKEQSRKLLGIDGDRVVLFVGRLDRIKGLDVLLWSVAQLGDTAQRLRLVVLGHDGERQAASYRSMIGKLGLGEVVDMRGVVAQDDLPLYYSAADVLAMPSAYESFGMAAVEAMACQTPVVAYRVGGLAASVKDGKTGFLAEPGNRQDFTQKLRTALTSGELEGMGRQARLSVQRFSWETVAERTLALYQRLVRERVYVSGRATSAN